MVNVSKPSLFYILLVLAPVGLVLNFVDYDSLVVFLISAISLIPLAKLIGDSTERLSVYYGPTVGSLLNVTFGNSAEIIIAIVAISAGLLNLVKASITGSILGNILLVFGLSLIAAGAFEKNKEQSFSRHNASIQTSMLFLAIIGLAVPTILSNTVLRTTATTTTTITSPEQLDNQARIQLLSDILAFLLLSAYISGIVFTFVTHKKLFYQINGQQMEEKLHGRPAQQQERQYHHDSIWSKKTSFLILAITMIGVVAVSEVLVDSVEATTKRFGFGELFVGAVVVGIVGNAAEHSSAIMLARKGKLDLSIGIAAGSGTQVALFVVPILVIAGMVMNHHFTLVFTVFELVAIFLAAIILNLIAHDGKSNWFEGFMLTIVYIIFAAGFFFIR